MKKESLITDIALEVANLVEKKNHDYGNSFDKTVEEYGEVAYFLRIEDKLSRLKSLNKKDAAVVSESVEDTLKDIIGYTLLMINYKREKEYAKEENYFIKDKV
ncbi:nucleotide modification associated domain-containing protein [Clostridium saudiense]|jgi:NTP pyrophosphatase (non-canonical NTP hydrolase)|uniref:nucleotide modification associated domain-containing protein n=1 Tax=Clostridium saudiense TaxID=1414720 RepID=UPI0018A90E9B|nr:nucleotide modification associated domain-containing protein [Clostridium saudiense]